MGRVVRLTEQELRGIVTDLIKMALSGDITNKEKPQDSENNDDSSFDKVSVKGQELLNDPIFKKKLKEISNAIHVDEYSIMKLMKHESGLNPEIKNNIGCVGLIQFCPDNRGGSSKTINGKSYTLDELRYNLEAQMDAIKEFWAQGYNNGKIKKPADLYLYNFLPIAAGKSDDFVLQSKDLSAEKIARSNPIFNKKLGKPASSPLTVGDMNRYYQMTGMV
jgi:hypothetical protein